MKRALVFQHMDYDHPGRFLDFFSEDGMVPEMVRLWEGQKIPNLAPYDFLFVLGGAQDTWQDNEHTWMLEEKAAIREWVWDRAKPYFGVCLGHQLLCDALGGEVALAGEAEVGVFDVSLTPDGHGACVFCRIGKQQQGHAVALGGGNAGSTGGEGSCRVIAQCDSSHCHRQSRRQHAIPLRVYASNNGGMVFAAGLFGFAGKAERCGRLSPACR